MQADSSTTTTTTTTKTKKLSSGTGGNMISSVAVTSAIKTTTTTRKPAGSGTSPKSPKSQASSSASLAANDSNAEIAELTKKINEHADAIYHTWKSQGIPPPELLQMYTNAAASGDLSDVASPTADAEGLQKIVTSFVNKDKEQRGKTNSLKKSDITSNGKVKVKPVVTSFNPVPDQALQSPKKVASISVTKPLPDVNLNYDISLDLDVNNLSSQQTQNLLKISELIQQQKDTPSTVGKKRQNSKANTNSNVSNSVGSNKLTASEQPTKKQSKASTSSSSSSRNGSIAVSLDVVDSPSAARMANSVALSDKGGEPAATNRTKSSKTKENSVDSTKPATKEKPTAVATATTARKSTSRIATDNTGNIAAAAASTSATSATPAATATSMDATPATSVSTTMPTLNKVKPTSGARAALTNGQDKMNLLTRGSVAERVLMFEKCPDVRHAFLNIKRPQTDTPPKSLIKVKLHATPPPPPQEQNLLQKEIRSTKSVYIPR
ncbi:mucin-5AC isoform X2 [Drosophila eugracilis]|nr:mucin-5AC isoform X2 [Drosophila eugracilis]